MSFPAVNLSAGMSWWPRPETVVKRLPSSSDAKALSTAVGADHVVPFVDVVRTMRASPPGPTPRWDHAR